MVYNINQCKPRGPCSFLRTIASNQLVDIAMSDANFNPRECHRRTKKNRMPVVHEILEDTVSRQFQVETEARISKASIKRKQVCPINSPWNTIEMDTLSEVREASITSITRSSGKNCCWVGHCTSQIAWISMYHITRINFNTSFIRTMVKWKRFKLWTATEDLVDAHVLWFNSDIKMMPRNYLMGKLCVKRDPENEMKQFSATLVVEGLWLWRLQMIVSVVRAKRRQLQIKRGHAISIVWRELDLNTTL